MRQAWNSRPSKQPQQQHTEPDKQCPALPAPKVAQIHDQLLVKNNTPYFHPSEGFICNGNPL
jgi:hypothetical protein